MFFLYVFLYNTKENRLQRKEKCRSKQGIKLLTFALQFLYIQLHWKWHMFQLNSVFQQENVFSTNFSRASVPFMNTFWMTRKVIYWKFEKLEAEFCLLASPFSQEESCFKITVFLKARINSYSTIPQAMKSGVLSLFVLWWDSLMCKEVKTDWWVSYCLPVCSMHREKNSLASYGKQETLQAFPQWK